MIDDLPFSQACENNKQPILEALARHLTEPAAVLEIAGGTGQHAVHFAAALPHLHWQTTDIPDNVSTLAQRPAAANLANLPAPLALDVNESQWPVEATDVVYSANCLHIISVAEVEHFMAGVGRCLQQGGLLIVYGPFKYSGEFTSPSNGDFDGWLKARDPDSGVRDFEWVNKLAEQQGLVLVEDIDMPANNQLLVWKRVTLPG